MLRWQYKISIQKQKKKGEAQGREKELAKVDGAS